jgi:hypothetical protein
MLETALLTNCVSRSSLCYFQVLCDGLLELVPPSIEKRTQFTLLSFLNARQLGKKQKMAREQ